MLDFTELNQLGIRSLELKTSQKKFHMENLHMLQWIILKRTKKPLISLNCTVQTKDRTLH
jgi:hypothetical protein